MDPLHPTRKLTDQEKNGQGMIWNFQQSSHIQCGERFERDDGLLSVRPGKLCLCRRAQHTAAAERYGVCFTAFCTACRSLFEGKTP